MPTLDWLLGGNADYAASAFGLNLGQYVRSPGQPVPRLDDLQGAGKLAT